MRNVLRDYRVLTILCLMVLSCSINSGEELEDLIVKQVNGLSVYFDEESPYTGRVVQYTEDENQLILDFNVLNGYIDGIYKEYNKKGTLKRSATYNKGELNGLEEQYYDNGQLKETVNYINGNYHGKRMVYWDNGTLKEKYTFSNGTLEGDVYFYFPNGKLNESLKFDAQGNRTGVWEKFYANGQLRQRVTYREDEVIETSPLYNLDGSINKN